MCIHVYPLVIQVVCTYTSTPAASSLESTGSAHLHRWPHCCPRREPATPIPTFLGQITSREAGFTYFSGASQVKRNTGTVYQLLWGVLNRASQVSWSIIFFIEARAQWKYYQVDRREKGGSTKVRPDFFSEPWIEWFGSESSASLDMEHVWRGQMKSIEQFEY